MYKVTVLYSYPKDPGEFERYYHEVHLPLARHMPNVSKIELTKFDTGPGGGKPVYHRMAELYFSSRDVMEESMGSPESQATIDDLHNLAPGGITILMGTATEDEN